MVKLSTPILILLTASLVAGATAHGANTSELIVSLLQDSHFRNGFKIRTPIPGKKNAARLMRTHLAQEEPTWNLCQWHSKYDLSEAKPEKLDAQTVRLANQSKAVVVSSDDRQRDLVLCVDSRPEYNSEVRKIGHPWPHLLVEQDDVPTHLLKDIDRIEFKIEAILLKNEREQLTGYSTELHSAQFLLTFLVQDCNRKSPGFGDFIWFNVAMYDERTKFCELHAAMDTADPSAKMIYAPPIKIFAAQSLHDGKWVTFSHRDISLLFRESIDLAHKKGFLKNSPDPNDFAISSVILGWEVTGINNVSMQVRNLEILLHKQEATSSIQTTPDRLR